MGVVGALAVLAVGTFALRAGGAALGGRDGLPPLLETAARLTAPALIAALLAVQTVVTDDRLVVDERVPAVAVAGLLAVARVPFPIAVVAGVATAALLRAL